MTERLAWKAGNDLKFGIDKANYRLGSIFPWAFRDGWARGSSGLLDWQAVWSPLFVEANTCPGDEAKLLGPRKIQGASRQRGQN